jgi:hypothetical protein
MCVLTEHKAGQVVLKCNSVSSVKDIYHVHSYIPILAFQQKENNEKVPSQSSNTPRMSHPSSPSPNAIQGNITPGLPLNIHGRFSQNSSLNTSTCSNNTLALHFF